MKARLLALAILSASLMSAQIYSPKVLRAGQPDATDLKQFAAAIYRQAGAVTPRAKAEAIWRFFLTDGRFVKPGFWYHIAGWAYEEPVGEVLDPVKLLNSYGFGLCYHIAPLLEAVYEAGGFADARVWFLTGHTVTEVFYDGAYHYFDSDMMGYNVRGSGPFQGKPVACVRQLEQDSGILLGKMAGPRDVRNTEVDYPWYTADVRAAAIPGLASLFTTTADNYLFPYTRYSRGHSMDFVLRPGEKLTRYFRPEEQGLAYLPYKFDGKEWLEFPQEFERYKIRTADGPHSQKDNRLWQPGHRVHTAAHRNRARIDFRSAESIRDYRRALYHGRGPRSRSFARHRYFHRWRQKLGGSGRTGPHTGASVTEPRVLARSAHGRMTAVSGTYGYKMRITRRGAALPGVTALRLTSPRIQLNPRTLAALDPGENQIVYTAANAVERIPRPVRIASARQQFRRGGRTRRELSASTRGSERHRDIRAIRDGRTLAGFDVGARFLDLRGNLAPEKLTAETRRTAVTSPAGPAAIEWSLTRQGPFTTLWTYPEKLEWRDGDPVDRLLLWPQVFREVRDLPAGTKRVFVRLRSAGPSIDDIRQAVLAQGKKPAGRLRVTHIWTEGGAKKQHVEIFAAGSAAGATQSRRARTCKTKP